ncbi:MAG: hypothetical protein ACJASD_000156 [Sphingomonas echinoides]|jgi:hypothetical protein
MTLNSPPRAVWLQKALGSERPLLICFAQHKIVKERPPRGLT